MTKCLSKVFVDLKDLKFPFQSIIKQK